MNTAMKYLIPSIFWLLVSTGPATAQAVGQNHPIRRSATQISFPYGFGVATAKATPDDFITISLQPGERLKEHTRDTRLVYRYGNRLIGRQLQQLLHIRPVDYDMHSFIHMQTDRRSYYLVLSSPPKKEIGGGQNGSFAKEIAFYYPSDTLSDPDYFAEAAAPDSAETALNNGPAPAPVKDTLSLASHDRQSYEWQEGRYSFPWEPQEIYTNGSKLILKAPQQIEKEGLPVLYAITGEERTEIPVNYDPSTHTLTANQTISQGVFVYRFYHPGPFGIGTRSGEKQLFITLKNQEEAS